VATIHPADAAQALRSAGGVDAVIFDWGGTLTPWKTADGRGWWRIAARLSEHGLIGSDRIEEVGAVLHAAEEEIWRRSREDHLSGTLEEVFAAAGLVADDVVLDAHDTEWDHATYIDPLAPATLAALRERGIRVGVLSNTAWSRGRHERIFVRDGVHHLIDGAVYTSEIAYTKPHPEAFLAAMAAVDVRDPAGCVFVGDRPFDDIYGARQVGMRAVLIPHSEIPSVQRGHTDGEPDAVIHTLSDLLDVIDAWCC
jgi:putative hydrolase of the HAD superfamily